MKPSPGCLIMLSLGLGFGISGFACEAMSHHYDAPAGTRLVALSLYMVSVSLLLSSIILKCLE